MRVIGIESSCGETGVAVYDTALAGPAALRAHAVYSQIALHAEYGGVVPELASRDHVRKLVPLVRQTLAEAGLSVSDIDGVAYTAGPGLVGALLVGAGVARSLAWALEVPAVGVHHMEGHLLAPLMEDDPPSAPFVALLVSGGHTQLVAVDAIGQYRLLHNGQPRDPFDALVQRELGLRYVLQARWTDSRSGIEYFFESAPLDENPERHARGRTIPVFIDPQDPQRYRMDLSFLPGQSPATPRSSVISPPRH